MLDGSSSLLVATSVFLLGITYVATNASVFSLRRKNRKPSFHVRGGRVIAGLAVIFSLHLILQCSLDEIILGSVLILFGIPIYIKYSPKKELTDLKKALLSPRSVLKRTRKQEKRFLAHLLSHIKRLYRRVAGKKPNRIQLELHRED